MSLPTPRFEAFLLRFVRDVPTSQWRGVIVHVQSNTEKSFTHFADALAFIKHDVTGGGFIFKGGNDAEGKSEWD